MKKIKILSAILSVIMAFSCLSVIPVNAETETEKTFTSLELVSLPDKLCDKPLAEIFYGTKLKIGYSDSTFETVTISNENSFSEYYDFTSEVGYGLAFCSYEVSEYESIELNAEIFVSDCIQIQIVGFGDDFYDISTVYEYPENYTLPTAFCKDNLSYRTNNDDTLTVVAMHEIYTGELDEYGFPIYQSEFEIPENVYGKKVTAVANNAFLNYSHATKVTIPESVKSIGTYAFGYCFSTYNEPDLHNIPINIESNLLARELSQAEDSEEFIVMIDLYAESYDLLAEYLIDTYFKADTEFTYDKDYGSITATLTKAEIFAMGNEDEITITPLYETDHYMIEDYLYDYMRSAPEGTKIPILITTTAYSLATGKTIAKKIMDTYFDGTTDYVLRDYDFIAVNATAEQVLAMKSDQNVNYLELNFNYERIGYDLFKEMTLTDDSVKHDIYIVAPYESDPKTKLTEVKNEFFANCYSEFFYSDYDLFLVVKGATKQQITSMEADLGSIDYSANIFGYPLINKYYDLEIHGTKGSAAEKYATENEITFVEIPSARKLGDVNGDGVVNVNDATDILKANVGIITLTDEQTKLADLDGNGRINVTDATIVMKMAVGLM